MKRSTLYVVHAAEIDPMNYRELPEPVKDFFPINCCG